jgi:predicted HNH restriction endonuclease
LTNFEKVKSELDKCILLCANCHREEHARERGRL